MIAAQSLGSKTPFGPNAYPTGYCIQLLFTMIQNDDMVVPKATMIQAKR
jgi:hypothetical protein